MKKLDYTTIRIKNICPECESPLVRAETCDGDPEGIRHDSNCTNDECGAIYGTTKSGHPNLVRSPKKYATVEVSVETLRNILRYCESMQVYDKLGAYGDFYYKINSTVRDFDEHNEWSK